MSRISDQIIGGADSPEALHEDKWTPEEQADLARLDEAMEDFHSGRVTSMDAAFGEKTPPDDA